MQRSNIRPDKIPSLIRKLRRRLSDLSAYGSDHHRTDWHGDANRIEIAVNATVDDVFGMDTVDATASRRRHSTGGRSSYSSGSSTSYSTGRTYYATRKLILCEDCCDARIAADKEAEKWTLFDWVVVIAVVVVAIGAGLFLLSILLRP